jgi:hypothetical protein
LDNGLNDLAEEGRATDDDAPKGAVLVCGGLATEGGWDASVVATASFLSVIPLQVPDPPLEKPPGVAKDMGCACAGAQAASNKPPETVLERALGKAAANAVPSENENLPGSAAGKAAEYVALGADSDCAAF